MLSEVAERVCQPTGGVPVASVIAATARAIASRSCASSIWACRSQRQPWAATSCPSATASCASQGESATARPLAFSVAATPYCFSIARMRGQPAPRAIFEMRFHAEIAHAGDLLDHLVDALIALVALSDRELRALLDID